jgi:hypothetical protein
MVLGAGMSYRDAVCERPWILLRHFCRFPVPFLSFERWKRSMARLYWLVAEYRITWRSARALSPAPPPGGGSRAPILRRRGR